MKQQNRLYIFFILYFCLFFGLGSFGPYINLWFEKVLHFNGIQIGTINAISLLVGIGFAPIFGMICDKTNQFKKILAFCLIMILILLQIYRRNHVYIFVLFIAATLEIFKSSAYPINDILTTDYAMKHNIGFGIIRTFGSLGYMVGSIFVGTILDTIGFDGALFTTYSITLLLSLWCVYYIPNVEKPTSLKQKSNILQILTNKNFYTIVIYMVATTGIIDVTSSFMGNYLVVSLQANQLYISAFTFVMVLPEIFLLPFSNRFLNYFGYKKFYFISSCIVFIRMLFTGLFPHPLIAVIMPILHFTSIVISAVGNIGFFRYSFQKNEIATVLTLYTACVGIIRASYSIIFGFIYQNFSGNMIFIFGSMITLTAVVLSYKTNIFNSIKKESIN